MDLHNNTILNNINSLVGKNDVLWILGDFCWGKWGNMTQVAQGYRDRINTKDVRLIRGNHDPQEILPCFTKAYDLRFIQLDKQGIVLSHYPMVSWKNKENGSWCLSGHCHGRMEEWRKKHMPDALTFDVGVDCWNYYPVSYDQVRQKMEQIKDNPGSV